MKIADVRVMRADIPVRRPHKMSFTTLEAVNFVFVRLEATDGQVGWGEAACLGGPTWSEESAESVAAIVERYVAPWLRGSEATGIEAVSREMARRVQGNPFARAAVEMALWDLNARALGVPVHRLLGGRVRDRVPLSWSLAVADHDAEIEEARAKVAAGHRIFKVKTGALAWAEDVARVRRLREALGPEIALRVDANQGWDRPTALRAIRALEPYGLDFVEQPVPRWDLEGMAEIGRRVDVPIMADESCCSPHDALALARLGGVSILGLKLTKSAGIAGSLAIARIRRGGGPDVLCRLHDRDLARHGGLPAGGARRRARRLGLRALRSAPAHRRCGAGARRLRERRHPRARRSRPRRRGRRGGHPRMGAARLMRQ
jgi:muconate/chloromuconate cycloisomerase